MLNALFGKLKTVENVNAEIERLMSEADRLEQRRAFILQDAAEGEHAAEKHANEYQRITLQLDAIPLKIEGLNQRRRQLQLEARRREFDALQKTYAVERAQILALWDEQILASVRGQVVPGMLKAFVWPLAINAGGTREKLMRAAHELAAADMLSEDEMHSIDVLRGELLTEHPIHVNDLEALREQIRQEVQADLRKRYGIKDHA